MAECVFCAECEFSHQGIAGNGLDEEESFWEGFDELLEGLALWEGSAGEGSRRMGKEGGSLRGGERLGRDVCTMREHLPPTIHSARAKHISTLPSITQTQNPPTARRESCAIRPAYLALYLFY